MPRLADLPEDVRRLILSGKVGVAGGAGLVTTRPPATRRTVQWRCHSCGVEFDAWAAAERHRDVGPLHGWIEVLFTQTKG